jgi:hypothetical protein
MYKLSGSLKLTLSFWCHCTAHIRALVVRLGSTGIVSNENKLTAAFRAPPGHTVACALDVHLSTAKGFPEPFDADGTHLGLTNGIDQLGSQGQPFFQVFYPKKAEAIYQGKSESSLF